MSQMNIFKDKYELTRVLIAKFCGASCLSDHGYSDGTRFRVICFGMVKVEVSEYKTI